MPRQEVEETMCNSTKDKSSKSDGVEKSKYKVISTNQDAGIIPTLAVTLWLGWMSILIYTTIFLLFFASTNTIMICLTICILSILLPRDFPYSLGTRIGNCIMLQAEKYFGLTTTIEDYEALELYASQNKALIFAIEPHDVLPYSVFAFNPCLKRLPGHVGEKNAGLMTSAVFNIPIIKVSYLNFLSRLFCLFTFVNVGHSSNPCYMLSFPKIQQQVYSWVGGQPVDRKTFKARLQRSESLAFVPGGVQEVTLMDPAKPDDILMYLRSRKGFIKMALQHGSPIVPVFVFHLDGSYNYWLPRGRLLAQVSRKIGFVPLFFTGRFGIPFFIPKPKKLHVVCGKPIEVPLEEEVSPESVDKYHSIFLQEFTALYDRHKHDAGYSKRKLVIV